MDFFKVKIILSGFCYPLSNQIPDMAVWYPAGYRRWLSDIQPETGDFCLISSRLPEMAVLIPARYQRWLSDIRPDTGDGCLISVRIPEMAVWYHSGYRRWLSDIRPDAGDGCRISARGLDIREATDSFITDARQLFTASATVIRGCFE